jgi:hypothetical protein
MMDITHARAMARMLEITDRIDPEWPTPAEILAIVAVLESADQRLNARTELRLVSGPDHGGCAR